MAKERIPNPVLMVVGDVLGGHYYSHTKLNTLFAEHGAPGDPPSGNCVDKCQAWLRRCNTDPQTDALAVLGGVLADFIDKFTIPFWASHEPYVKGRQRVLDALQKNGLAYSDGRVIGTGIAAPSRSLADQLRSRDLQALRVEFDRAIERVDSDPPAALTAACAIVESFCKVYIEDEGLRLPAKLTVKPLWSVVADHLGLQVHAETPADARPILSGLAAVVDGLGAYRTHEGSAHGGGREPRKVLPRHARLAVHAAHTLVAYALETWDARRQAR